MTPDDRMTFDRLCVDEFGQPSRSIKYRLHDFEDRISKLENYCNEKGPVIGATIAKIETVASLLGTKNIVSDKEINDSMHSLLKNYDTGTLSIEGN